MPALAIRVKDVNLPNGQEIVIVGTRDPLGDMQTYSFMLTYADGGKEDYVVNNIHSSINLTTKPVSLKQGGESAKPASCGAG